MGTPYFLPGPLQGKSANPTIATTVGIARALGVSLDYLAGLSAAQPDLHPEALRIACEVDALLRGRSAQIQSITPRPAPNSGGEDA